MKDPLDQKDERVIVWEHGKQTEADGRTVNYSPTTTGSIVSNSAIYLLFSLQQTKSSIYYLCDYLTKDSAAITNIIPLLAKAKEHIEIFPSVASDSGENQRTAMHLMTSLLNNINGLSEMPVSMISHCLLGNKPHIKTFENWYCYIRPAIQHVKSVLRQNKALFRCKMKIYFLVKSFSGQMRTVTLTTQHVFM